MACGRLGRQDPREFRHQDPRQEGCSCLHQESAQAPRLCRNNHHGRPTILRCCNGRARQSKQTGDWPLGQQQGGEQPSAFPKARTGDAQVPANEVATNVRLSPCLASQPLRHRPPPYRPPDLQDQPLCRPGRVAIAHGLNSPRPRESCVNRRLVAVGLTAPNFVIRATSRE